MKHAYFFFIVLFVLGCTISAEAQAPANDECATATSLGTLPAPAACTGTGTKRGATVTLTNQTNVNATPSNPYPYISACAINTASIPNDVWYSFTASSYQATIAVSAATGTLTNPTITFWSGTCGNQASSGCVTGAANAASLTVYQLVVGQTYYIQIAGADATQNGTFTLKVHNDNDCANCLVSSSIVATPPPVNGTYAPGQTVTFCYTVNSWDETNTNWLHGVQPSFGSGWNLSTLTAGTPPASIDGRGTWSWQPTGVVSSANNNQWPAGFYYNSSLPNNYVGGAGNSYGDDCNTSLGQTCTWTFCVSITANTACSPGSNLSVTFNTSGDGESGVWSSLACQNDQPAVANAIGSCCPPTMTATPASCANPHGGTATATPTGNISPWTFHWSNGTVQTLYGPSTVTGLAAGIDTVTVTDALNCSTIGVVTVTNTSSVNAGPAQTVSCLPSLPGGTVTMAASGAGGSWTAQAGNPGAATITTPSSPTTTITNFSAAGVYTFVWADSGCNATTTVTVTAKPNAGPDQTVSCVALPGGSATMAATGTGTWTAQAGNPGTATITTPTSPTTIITTYSAAGIYHFIWTDGNGCTDTANVTVVPLPNAGPDQTLNCVVVPGGSATMAAVGLGFWQAAAGNPGSATITSTFSANTTITGFSAPGTYQFVWSIGVCTDTAAVIVSAAPSAGPDQFVTCFPVNTSTTMAATGSGTWTAAAANPGAVTITTPTSPTTSITGFGTVGVYQFFWTNGSCVDTALVTVTGNANAGPDQTVSCVILPGGAATMAATGSGTWTALTGNPGTSVISNPNSATTSITTFGVAGTYNYIWTSGGCSDTAAVIVTAKPDAGPDQTVSCIIAPGGSATMAATGAGTWSADPANPGTASITSTTDPQTTITTFTVAGTYGFIWTNGSCADTALVVVTTKPDAGPDAAVCPNDTANLAGVGSGLWVALPTNPVATNILTAGSPTTAVAGLSTPGSYGFVWISGGCTDTAFITVHAVPTLNPSAVNITCANANGIIYANGSGASPLSYQWNNGSAADSVISTTAGVLYTVTVTDNNRCTATASDSVSNRIVTVTLTDVQTNVSCYGYNDGQIIVSPSPAGTYTYTWDHGGTGDTLSGLAPGSYSATATDANGCSSSIGPITITSPGVDSVSITPMDTTVFLGDTIQMGSTVMGAYAVHSYLWTPSTGISCDTCPNPLLIPTDFDTVKRQYQLTITYYNGCTAIATDSILARPNDLSAVPNAFSPNGDSKNPDFRILATGVGSFVMNIYNRWGQQVFTSTDINQGWDGNYKGKEQPGGVYTFFYTITYHDGKVESREGTVTLFR